MTTDESILTEFAELRENDTTDYGCPDWCTSHPENEPETHASKTWRGHGLAVSMESNTEAGAEIHVDHGLDFIDLTATQARTLAVELVRYAAMAEQVSA